jgi:hypothetical protein
MWTHTRMSFSSHTFTSLPLVHTKPGLFGMTTLTLLLSGSWISPRTTSELDFWQIPELAVLRSSWLCQFEVPGFRMFATPSLRRFKIPENRMSANLRLRRSKIPEIACSRPRGFVGSQIPENRECPTPEKHISRTSLNSMFRGWRVFLNSPT